VTLVSYLYFFLLERASCFWPSVYVVKEAAAGLDCGQRGEESRACELTWFVIDIAGVLMVEAA
jgi:hypothetical protein